MQGGRGLALLAMSVLLTGIAACEWQPSTTTGLQSLLRIEGAQAVRGSINDPVTASDATVAPSTKTNLVFPGVSNKVVSGVVGPDASMVAIGIGGDEAYWLVPALTPENGNPGSYKFSAQVSFSPLLRQSALIETGSDGTTTLPLSFRAVDASGGFGSATNDSLTVALDQPTGTMVISLEWDAPVDLDLHVQVPVPVSQTNPDGLAWVWSKKPAAVPSQTAPDGRLDFDSNANCLIDGRDNENVIWTGEPLTGHYIVRVDPFSLCGQVSAAWHATAYYPSGTVAPAQEASGVLTAASTRYTPTEDAGITAFEFDYP
jgi:hypothetical protein